MIVAKDLTEYQLIKKARMKELQQKIKVRNRFERDYNHMIETGVSLNLEGYREPNELESFLNKQNIDANLQRLLVSKIGATVYVAKQFIQSLDSTLKERLLERFPIFQETFEKNFTKATPNTLQATHSMLSMSILKNEQKPSLPNLNQVKDFVKNNIDITKKKKDAEITERRDFINILDAKSGKKSPSYLSAIDNLFESMKYIDALSWLSSIMENNFGAPDLPIITINNRSDIRSSMITEGIPMEDTPMEGIPKQTSRVKIPKAKPIKIKPSKVAVDKSNVGVSRFVQKLRGEQAEEQEV